MARRWWRQAVGLSLFLFALPGTGTGSMAAAEMLIDDFTRPELISALGTGWRAVSDQVMGGVSEASMERQRVGDHSCLHLSGPVRLDNNGGFIQAALNLSPAAEVFDASAFAGLRLSVRGNGERYALHLRTTDNTRPWQSYRASFVAGAELKTVDLPFQDFEPHRLQAPLDVTRLKRIGLVAIGRAFQADVTLCEISFYR